MDVQPAEGKAECPFCEFQSHHRSSLIRHLKNKCNRNRPLRRKSCSQCVADKAKCNLRRPRCSRCHARDAPCLYASAEEPESPGVVGGVLDVENYVPPVSFLNDLPAFPSQSLSSAFDPTLFDSFFTDAGSWLPLQPQDIALRSPQHMKNQGLDSLCDSVDCLPSTLGQSQSIQEKQQNSNPNSVALAEHSMELIFRVLRTWPHMLAEEFQLPPIFHSTQLASQVEMPRPLATCITLVKMWHGQCAGAEGLVRDTILRELDLIIRQPQDLDEPSLLGVLQAVVIYTIILLSPTATLIRPPTDDDIVFRKVEILVWHVVRGGLCLPEERAQTRPSWQEWVHVTSKRRAVLTLYLLHWAYSVLHKVPCFDCRDLGFMPAPAPKALWQACTEHEWNSKYIHWLSRWNGQIYLQAEFGHIPPGVNINQRAEKWLGEADEFGFIMASILNASEFDPPALKLLQKNTNLCPESLNK